jgi:hypothetical protein
MCIRFAKFVLFLSARRCQLVLCPLQTTVVVHLQRVILTFPPIQLLYSEFLFLCCLERGSLNFLLTVYMLYAILHSEKL